MTHSTLAAFAAMPLITLPTLAGDDIALGGPADQQRLILVYRGLHCPICKTYLRAWQEHLPALADENVALYAISGDNRDKAAAFAAEVGLDFPVGYDLNLAAMRQLGLYVTDPLAHETDRPFPEPALFLVDTAGNAHIVEIANAPFVRPEPALILRGLAVIRTRDYPIRGTLT
ncbi:MAG: peroxiredoxin-like family protein [Thalassobaculaceae bacterium]